MGTIRMGRALELMSTKLVVGMGGGSMSGLTPAPPL